MWYTLIGIARVDIFRLLSKTGLCNKSAIRLCAVDLSERVKGVVKSNSWLAGVSRVLFQQKTSLRGSFLFYSFPSHSTRETFLFHLQIDKNLVVVSWDSTSRFLGFSLEISKFLLEGGDNLEQKDKAEYL